MEKFARISKILSDIGGFLAAAVTVYIVLHILLEVALRALFSKSTFVLDEFVGYGMAAVVFLSLGHAFSRGSMIRVNLLLACLPAGSRRVLEILATGLTLAVIGFTTYFFLVSVVRNFSREATSGTIASTPLWIPEALALLGLLIFGLQLASYLLMVLASAPLLEDSDQAEHDIPFD